ncbi:ABC transporter substrate-binding protein [Rhizobium puerariae]|uniref:ABC transporter substrate-binding protein n=1 Tax=Rhizobium puerariae TaxID=1585791 RepID=A0ABV6AIX9_9HYPH
MFDRRQFLKLGAGGAVTALTLHATARAQSTPAGYPADYGSIIEGSRKESGLIVYSNMSDSQWKPLLMAFREKYPWITPQTLDVNGSEAMERYLAETSTGSRSADLLMTVAPSSWIDMIARNEIVDYSSPEAAAFPAWSKPHPGLYTSALDPLVFFWNKALLPKELWPASFADLVEKVKKNPAIFNKKLTSYGAHLTSYGHDAHFFFAKHHGDKVWDWYRTIGPATRFERAAGPMVEKVTTGEYVLGYFCGSAASRMAAKDPARSQIVAMSYINDGTPMVFRGLGIPKKSTSVNSAKLLLDFALSETGQKALSAGSRTPLRPSITAEAVSGGETYASITQSIGEKNAIMVSYDPALVKDSKAFVARWREANGV